MEAFSVGDRNKSVGAERGSSECLGKPNRAGLEDDSSLRFATSAGVFHFNPESFMADVVNSVNDLIVGGFDSFEEFAAESLNLQNEEARSALQNGVDKIYNKVKDNIDEHLSLWESSCRTHYFNVTSDAEVLNTSDNADGLGRSRESAGIEELQEQDEILNTELCFLRSQLIMAERDASRMRRELTSLRKKITLKRKMLYDLKTVAHLDSSLLAEVTKSASLLQIKIEKASSLVQGPKLQADSMELVQMLPQAANITVDPKIMQFLS
ncbi:hypothetical protein Mapa_012431 [Marchantia paleacea]|nr:hypothetical protein Mapa_012431 [Marchantia paleacea]